MFDALPAPAAPALSAAPLIRPRILACAARHGAALYRRERDLKGLLPAMATPSRKAGDIVRRLAPIEAEMEGARRAGAPDYSPRRHVSALAALLAERAAAEGRAFS